MTSSLHCTTCNYISYLPKVRSSTSESGFAHPAESRIKWYCYKTSLPYFGVKLSRVCLKVTYSYPKVTHNYPRVTYSDPRVNHSDPTHFPLPPPASPGHHLAIS